MRAALLIASALSVGCHPPPAALSEAKRVVVVAGPPAAAGQEPEYMRAREMPAAELDAAACAKACAGVPRSGERVTACYELPPRAFGTRSKPDHVTLQPTSLHVCAVQ